MTTFRDCQLPSTALGSSSAPTGLPLRSGEQTFDGSIGASLTTTLVYLILLLSLGSAAIAQDGMPPSGPTGFVVTGPEKLAIWSARGQQFGLWSLQLGSAPRWTNLPLPEELTRSLAKNSGNGDDEDSGILVTYANGRLHIFWVDAEPCARASARQCSLVYSAETALDVVHWSVSQSRLRNEMFMDSVDQVVLTPDDGGWMTLTGEPGAGQLPSLLAVSRDGGRTWSVSPAAGMPIGRNHPELTIVRSAKEAWAIAVDLDDEDPPLVVAHTIDGGANWLRNQSIPQTVPWCQQCHAEELSRQDNAVHAGRTCFEMVLRPDKPGHPAEGRYCLSADGGNWGPPIPLTLPAEMNQSAEGFESGELPMFVTAVIGFQVDWTDVPTGNGTTSRKMIIYQTGDGGRTWSPSKLMQVLHPEKDLVFGLQQAAPAGDDIVVLFADADDRVLLRSRDKGETWTRLAGR